jgi:hypothetical protein
MNANQRPWAGIVIGGGLIALWYIVTRTTLALAYRGGTLSQVQGMCNSNLGMVSRAMSARGDAACNHISALSTWWNLAGFTGLALILGCGAWLIYRSQHKPPADAESISAGHQSSA